MKKHFFHRAGAVCTSAVMTVGAMLAVGAASPMTASAADGDNYAKLLQYSLYFYDGNMCGSDVDTNSGFTWRGNCHTNDEVVGGYHDAGDHVMFGQPQGYTASTLGWAYYEFKDAFEATGQAAHLKLITDRFCKFFRDATVLNGDSVSKVLIEKGEGGPDHMYWGPPEQQGDRGRMLWTNGGAANVTAQYAASLAANYVNFGNPDDLKYAKALYEFSKKDTGFYSAGTFYDAHWTGSEDELNWAAGWLYLATKDDRYKNDIAKAGPSYSNHSWESVQLGAGILKGEITGDWGSANFLNEFKGNGYCFLQNWEWGSARHNSTAQFCSLVAAKYNKGDAGWAKNQMQYITGDKAFANGQSHCLVVGFKPNASSKPHHRAASGTNSAETDGVESAHVLVGALCGGPTDGNGTYADKRSDYQANEVALDYNAGFVGAAAGLYHFYKTGTPDSNIAGVDKVYTVGSSSQTTEPTQQQTQPTQQQTQPTQQQTQPTQQQTQPTQQNTTPSSDGNDIVLMPSDMEVGPFEGDDGAMNNAAEFKPQGAKSATLYLTVKSNDTEVSGGFGTWTGKWEQVDFSGVKVNSDKTVAIDYEIPSNVGQTVKAMVWWPHGDDVVIDKVVLHMGGKNGSSNNTTSATTTTSTTTTTTTTTTATTTSTTTTTTTTTTSTTQREVEANKWGDANCSGKADVSDAVLIARFVAEDSEANISAVGKKNADVNHNGNIDTEDVTKVLKFIAKLISEDDLAH